MHKVSLILAVAALCLQNAGQRAATNDLALLASQPVTAPQPAVVTGLSLIFLGVLVLMARATLAQRRKRSPKTPVKNTGHSALTTSTLGHGSFKVA